MPTLLLISGFPPPYGGVSNQAKQIAEAAEVELGMAPFVLDLSKKRIFACTDGEWRSLPVVSAGTALRALVRAPGFLLAAARMFAKAGLLRADGYLGWRLKLLAVALLTLSRTGKPSLVYSFHVGAPSLTGGFIAEACGVPHHKATFGEPFTNFEKLYVQRRIMLATGGADRYHPCSHHCDRLLKAVFPEIKSEVLYYGSDLIELAARAEMQADSPRRGAIRVLYLGRIEEEMGVRFFLKTADNLENAHPGRFSFTVCGQRGALSDEVRAWAEAFEGSAVFLESVPMAQRNECLVAADILIVPSVNERACFGLAVVEGMASRSFVLARDIGGHAEAALHKQDHLFSREATPEELAWRVVEVAEQLDAGEVSDFLVDSSRAAVQAYDIAACLERQLSTLRSSLSSAA